MNVAEGNVNSSSHQRSKAEPKWQGFTSLLLGFVSLLIAVSIVAAHFHTWSAFWNRLQNLWMPHVMADIAIGPIFGGSLFATAGFILGIMGLKYTKRKLAIAGIVLSVIGFMVCAYLFRDATTRYL